jgi:tetratricopeptide (TPR) repeat protein
MNRDLLRGQMADWQKITQQAKIAKKEMILSAQEGQVLFEQLLNQHGADGMIFFKRAEAWEALGEFKNALADFRKAKALFPMAPWKAKAQEGIDRTEYI